MDGVSTSDSDVDVHCPCCQHLHPSCDNIDLMDGASTSDSDVDVHCPCCQHLHPSWDNIGLMDGQILMLQYVGV